MPSKPVIPILLCGGFGTRLWPLSRQSFPKQFLSLNEEEKKSFLQKTQERINNINNIKNPILICNEEHRFIVAEQMREININPNSILLEPFAKNTAPAIALAALKSLEIENDPFLLILSSDHEIKDEISFIKVIEEGIEYAEKGRLVTFGIVPNSPETGYGYIKSEEEFKSNIIKGSNIISFTEKPNRKEAEKFLKDKRFTWNSGMFLFKASKIIKEMEKFCPEILKYCKEALADNLLDLDFQRLNEKAFSKCPSISIDVAVMEKTKIGTVLPLDAGWSDVGNWDSVWQISKKDENNNVLSGNVISENSFNCYVKSEKRLVAALGLNNLIVVETGDAVLISNRDNSQEVKDIVNQLRNKGIPESQEHKKIYRPWGYYESVVDDKRWKVKLINVKSGEKLSLQMHHHRSEHWIVVNGTALVEIEDKKFILNENQSSYIPLGAKHRLSNPGKINLTLIEVQSGSYLGEDDIERFEDNYGRLT